MALFVESGSDGNQNSIDALTRYAPKWHDIYDESRRLVGEGTCEIQNLQQEAEERHRFYTCLSYISFFLGWSVGLLSNLATGKTEESAGG
jgi:hypothetical protein